MISIPEGFSSFEDSRVICPDLRVQASKIASSLELWKLQSGQLARGTSAGDAELS